jgi:hypothetical protein
MTPDPRSTYHQLLSDRRSALARLQERHRTLGYAKLATAGIALLLIWLSLARGTFSIVWVLVPIAAFAILVVVHGGLLQVIERVKRSERYFEASLERLDGNWSGAGEPGERYLDPEHPYAQDLDLFGKASLFQLLCTARTLMGQDTLADWLKSPADAETVRQRQESVHELRPRVDLREELAVLAEEARSGVDPAGLARWGEMPVRLREGPREGWFRAQVRIYTAIGLIAFAALWTHLANTSGAIHLDERVGGLVRDVFLVGLLINGWFLYRTRMVVGEVVSAVEEAANELRLLSEVLVRIEREQFRAPMLARLRASLESAGEPPSRRLERLKRLVEYLDSRDNVFVRILEPFLLWTPHLALKVEDWREQSGAAVRRWLHAAGDMEALCSLASHAYEHPLDTFPQFISGGPDLEAQAIGHPLLPEERVVRNDIRIGGPLRVLVVSGSNMSGKSTMLRTVGVNTVLAQAGSVVRAESMRLSPLQTGASIRVSDSLQGGVSRFYAELLRLRQILNLTTGPLPVLFLIDEFMHGTNSHDRRIGAEALVKGLVERGAAGMVTTHDLALADIATHLGERAENVHFEDRIQDGSIIFDYRMRPGIVRRSNAIELMRQVGLEV